MQLKCLPWMKFLPSINEFPFHLYFSYGFLHDISCFFLLNLDVFPQRGFPLSRTQQNISPSMNSSPHWIWPPQDQFPLRWNHVYLFSPFNEYDYPVLCSSQIATTTFWAASHASESTTKTYKHCVNENWTCLHMPKHMTCFPSFCCISFINMSNNCLFQCSCHLHHLRHTSKATKVAGPAKSGLRMTRSSGSWLR